MSRGRIFSCTVGRPDFVLTSMLNVGAKVRREDSANLFETANMQNAGLPSGVMQQKRHVAVELAWMQSRRSSCILCACSLVASAFGFELPLPANNRGRALEAAVRIDVSSVAFLPSSPAAAAWFLQDPQEGALFHPSFLEVVLATLASGLLLAIVQASFAVINYRSNFGDAPSPIIPSHGVVIATNENPQDSLRLLLVGDSLAVGVGQSVTCTPILPEVISRVISRETGKAVFWTCHGESGASTRRILQELERASKTLIERVECDTDDCEEFKADGLLVNNKGALERWRKNLNEYREHFRPDSLGPYDIVIVLTGTNDLKIMLFPFLIGEEDKELRRQSNGQGGFIDDLQQLMLALNERMERGMLQMIEELAERGSETLRVTILENLEVLEEQFKAATNAAGIESWKKEVRANIDELERLYSKIHLDADESPQQHKPSQLTATKERQMYDQSDSEAASHSSSPFPLNKIIPRALPTSRSYDELDTKESLEQQKPSQFNVSEERPTDTDCESEATRDSSSPLPPDASRGIPVPALPTLRSYDEIDTSESPEQQEAPQLKVSDERPPDDNESEGASDLSSPLPLYVLPGVPARALPTLRNYPLRWLALSVFDSLAIKKRQLAESSPGILFVEGPALKDVIDYESQHGQIWEQRSREEVLLSLRAIRKGECGEIEEAMKEYYQNKSESYDTVHNRKPLFERPGMPGNKVFCADRIHPNEAGYDYWGRHIANAIINEWKRKEVN